uniref:Solute carrier family 26 member 5 n=1 Tax=Oncorhynchus kisutch TaxID=8019 RepID=A0A8C7L0Y4_ONCKI
MEQHVTPCEDAPPPLMYRVERPVFDEAYLHTQLLHPRERSPKTIRQRLAHCSSERAKAIALSFLPILTWLPSYPVKEYLFGDLVSGLSTGVMQLPQGLAYAMLAAVPPVYGLYSSFYPVLLYTFFGTSRHISIGTFAVISLMIGGVVVREAPDSMFMIQALNGTATNTTVFIDTEARDARRVHIAVVLTTLVGVIQLVLGLLRFGFVAIYLTEPLVRGFTTAAAVHVFISQLKYLLGIQTPRFSGPLSALHSVTAVFSDITSTNVTTLIVGGVCMVVLYCVKDLNERFKKKLPVPIPGEIIVVMVSTGISYGLSLSENYQVDVVRTIPSGLLPPAIPDFSLLPNLVTDSIAIAVVGFSMGISLAKIFALKHGYSVDGNQELIALGLCNFVSSFFHTFAITCSMSRSLVQESTGGNTQIAGLLASMVVLLVVVAIGFVFQPLPQTALAAIIMVNLLGMFKQFRDIPALWRTSKIELAIWLVAFVASVLLGLDLGLLVALGFAILSVIYRTQSETCDSASLFQAAECTGIKIFHSNSSIYFANSDLYLNALKEKTGVDPVHLQAIRKARKRKLKKESAERESQNHKSPQKMSAVVKLVSPFNMDLELGVTHEVVAGGGSQNHLEVQGNGQVAETHTESDSEETRFLEPLCPVHTLILDWTPVNFIDSVGAKAIKLSVRYRPTYQTVCCFLTGTLLAELRTLQFFTGVVAPEMVFPTVHDAVLHCRRRTAPPTITAIQ